MNKAELVEEVAGKVGLTKKETNNVVDAIMSAITDSLAMNERVRLVDFGSRFNLSGGIDGRKKEMPIARAGIERDIIVQGYAFCKANSEKRAITLEDLKEGYALAEKFMGEQGRVSLPLQVL